MHKTVGITVQIVTVPRMGNHQAEGHGFGKWDKCSAL